ncbi:MAG: ABC transporter ATP-binding protein [Actinobacteria bacterium]|nr:ABC transporter ATP-binding protein [Actinomycetota bacterium]MBU1943961.1 ABC transporter ATP-binding protein [Actinomycetota bacterium]MBU2686951.1 ABC transporter ATP-binding protein [Actinomycetota bacterium]
MEAESTENAIETRGLTKRFGRFTAVDSLDLEIARGEIYGLLGPNGAGKTTTIKMLCGLLKTTDGRAQVAGMPAGDRRASADIGYMPQEVALYEGLTVHQNIRFFGRVFGLSGRQTDEREEELLEFVNLAEWRDVLVARLSGGMKHRVSLTCALVHSPALLLLDEPTVGVDPELRVSFWDYFTRIKGRGRTIVITTHYMDEARRCDRIGFMRDGRLIAEGTVPEIQSLAGKEDLEDAFMVLAERSEGGEAA